MREPNNTETWGEIGTPTDLWSVGKSLTPMSPDELVEAWRKTVRTLEGLCTMADALMLEPLQLALVDAKGRAEEELERATDAAERPEGVEVSEGEERRLRALLRRSDALNNAWVAVYDWPADSMAVVATTLEVLEEMKAEATHNFEVYRREVGLE
jgi:hypothetical protein